MNLALLLLLGGLWGSSYLLIKITVTDVPALTLVAGRLALSTSIIALILGLRRHPLPRDRRTWKSLSLLGLLNTALPYTLISWGEQYITSSMAALLTATMPLFTLLLAHRASQERITPLRLLGIAVGFAGVMVLMLPDLETGLSASLWGQLAVVAATVSYAIAAVVARRYLQNHSPLTATAGQLGVGMLIMAPLSLLIDRPFRLSPSPAAWTSWVALTVVGTVVAYLLYFYLIARTSATFVSTVTYIIPLGGLVLGALVLDEPIGPHTWISLVLILCGVLLVRI